MKLPENGVAKRILTPDDNTGAQYFFGYYDVQAYSADDRFHLFHKVNVPYVDRLPTKNDVAELGYIDTKTGETTIFAETTAWNFQQGAMLQWNPAAPNDEVIFNIREEYSNSHEFRCVTLNLRTGKLKVAERAIANVSPDGKWGLAINMPRVYNFRPGYGYSDLRDRWYDIAQPEDDGIYLVNMETGASKLIISYARLIKEFPNEKFIDCKFVVNHITFNPASNRFLFLNRNFKSQKGDSGWATSLFTSDLEGNVCRLLDCTMVSHYNWKDDKTILGYLTYGGVNGVFEVDDMSCGNDGCTGLQIDIPCFKADLHTIYSPDHRFIIGDCYPDREKNRRIYLYECATGEWAELLCEYSHPSTIGDNRCDLHNLWNHAGTKISYDSTHRGKREICELDVSFLNEQ